MDRQLEDCSGMSSGTSSLSVSLSELRAGAGPAHPEGGNQHQTYTTTAATRHACPGARDGALPFGSCALPLLTLRSLPVALGYHQTLSKYTDSAPSFSGWAPVPHGVCTALRKGRRYASHAVEGPRGQPLATLPAASFQWT